MDGDVEVAVEAQSVCKNDHFMTLLMIFTLRCVFPLHLLFRLITHAQKVCHSRANRTKPSQAKPCIHSAYTIINLYANSSHVHGWLYVSLDCSIPGIS